MPNLITSELTSWQGETVIGASGDIYRIDDATNDGLGVRVWVWNAKHRDLDELDPAGHAMTRDEALAAIEAHTLAALAAKDPTQPTDDEQRQDELRQEAAKKNGAFADLLNAVTAITDDADHRATLAALDAHRADTIDRMSTEYWVFPGVPISRIRGLDDGDNPLRQAEEDAAAWAEKTRDQATVVSVRVEKNPDGSKWAPALYFQFQGVLGVAEEHLRKNPEQERFDD
ncbi:hypothetical protein ACWGJ9_09770 [Curtobacterium citreum]